METNIEKTKIVIFTMGRMKNNVFITMVKNV